MSGWCSNHNEAPMRVGGDGDKDGRHDEKPKTLAEIFLPQLTTPTLCILSGLLLVLSNGLQFLEGRSLGGRTDNSCPSEHSISNDPLVCHDGGSPRTTAVEALLLSIFQLRLFYPTLLLLTLVSLLRLQYNRQLKITRTTSAVPGLPSVPNAHPYFGHYRMLSDPLRHSFIFRDHATPSGISSIWGPGLKRCAAVLQASHARLVLRQNSQRDFSEWIVRHGRKSLGEDSLILIPGGAHWKSVRKVVARAFTHNIVRDQRLVIGKCARELVDWLEWSCDADASRGGGGGNDAAQEPIEACDFFKLYSYCVFGRVAMGHDFQSIPTNKGGIQRPHPSSSKRCMPPEAEAFESIVANIGLRSTSPRSFMNPAMQLYWIPTRTNRAYWKNSNMVDEMMGLIIGNQLDCMLRSSLQKEREKENKLFEGCPAGENADSSLLSYLIQSSVEKHFSIESSSACPFVASSQSRSTLSASSSCAGVSSFQFPSEITPAARKKIIEDISKILRTLLLAGYETTSISLSYTMYSLANSPRCQERCCEEARRVLVRQKKDESMNSSHSSDGDGEDSFDADDDDLPYCRAVLMEAIRLNMPVIFTTRVISKDLSLETGNEDDEYGKGSRVTILKGTRIVINPQMIHRDERNFDRAEEFVPERWVRWDEGVGRWVDRDYNAEAKKSTEHESSLASSIATPPSLSSKYTIENSQADCIPAANPANFFAFSDGARNCVGRRLALLESTLLIAELFRNLCVGFADKDFQLVKKVSFVTVRPSSLPIKFWKR